jgi:hypothetical protein
MLSGETSPGIPVIVEQHSHFRGESQAWQAPIEIVRKGRNGESNTYSIRFKSTHDHNTLDNTKVCGILKASPTLLARFAKLGAELDDEAVQLVANELAGKLFKEAETITDTGDTNAFYIIERGEATVKKWEDGALETVAETGVGHGHGHSHGHPPSDDEATIWVGNIPDELVTELAQTEGALANVFAGYGKITSSTIRVKPEGLRKHWALVSFGTREAVVAALAATIVVPDATDGSEDVTLVTKPAAIKEEATGASGKIWAEQQERLGGRDRLLKPGDFFNTGLAGHNDFSCTQVIANSDSHVLTLHRDSLEKVIQYCKSTKDKRATNTANASERQRRKGLQRTKSTDMSEVCLMDHVRDFLPTRDDDDDGYLADLAVTVGAAAAELRPSFSPEISDYMVSVPANQHHLVAVVPHLARPKQVILRTVPIVVLCYGGGPMTIKTLIAAGDKPLIIVRGSDRAAKFVDDWVGFERRKRKALEAGQDISILSQQQRQRAEESLRRDIAPTKKKTYESAAKHFQQLDPVVRRNILLDKLDQIDDKTTKEIGWWNVNEFIECLEMLGNRSQLSFFDMLKDQKKMRAKERLNPMLPILATSIFSSKTIKTTVKLVTFRAQARECTLNVLNFAHSEHIPLIPRRRAHFPTHILSWVQLFPRVYPY